MTGSQEKQTRKNIVIFELLGYMDEKRKCYLAALVLAILMLLLTHSRTSFMATAFLLLFFSKITYQLQIGIMTIVIYWIQTIFHINTFS